MNNLLLTINHDGSTIVYGGGERMRRPMISHKPIGDKAMPGNIVPYLSKLLNLRYFIAHSPLMILTKVTNPVNLDFLPKRQNLLSRIIILTLLQFIPNFYCWEQHYGYYESPMISKPCYFPQRWHGTWSQTTFSHNLTIQHNEITDKGICLTQMKQRFLLYNKKQNCYQCLYITEKHYNVLQFKESFCGARDSLEAICNQIGGDAFLYTLFRTNPSHIRCPFHDQKYSFTYSGEFGDCRGQNNAMTRHFPNTVESCTNPSQLLFRFQSCSPNIESGALNFKLSCLADWKEGNKNFLAGTVDFWDRGKKPKKTPTNILNPSQIQAPKIQDKYRCFIYEKTQTGYHISMSYDSTCFGIFSAKDGPHIFELKKEIESIEKDSHCYFPAFFNTHKTWPLLDKSGYFEPILIRTSTGDGQDFDIIRPLTGGKQYADQEFDSILSSLPTHRSKTLHYHKKSRQQSHSLLMTGHDKKRRSQNIGHYSKFDLNPIEQITCVDIREESIPLENSASFTDFKDSNNVEMSGSTESFTPSRYKMVVYSVFGCFHGYKCLFVHRRSPHIIELQEGILAPTASLACNPEYYDVDRQRASIRFSTLAAETTPQFTLPCPMNGIYEIVTTYPDVNCQAGKFSFIDMGCRDPNMMDIQHVCTSRLEMKTISMFKCHAYWKENGLRYLISSEYHSKYLSCFVIKEDDITGVLTISNTRGICRRNINPEIDGIMRYHAISTRTCQSQSNKASEVQQNPKRLKLWFFTILITFYIHSSLNG